MGLFEKLKAGLAKTRETLFAKVAQLVSGKTNIDPAMLERLEEILLSSDVGVETTMTILDNIKNRVKRETYETPEHVLVLLKDEIAKVLHVNGTEDATNVAFETTTKPWVVMVVG